MTALAGVELESLVSEPDALTTHSIRNDVLETWFLHLLFHWFSRDDLVKNLVIQYYADTHFRLLEFALTLSLVLSV